MILISNNKELVRNTTDLLWNEQQPNETSFQARRSSKYIVRYINQAPIIIYLSKLKHILRFIDYNFVSVCIVQQKLIWIFGILSSLTPFSVTKTLRIFSKHKHHLLACSMLLHSKNSQIVYKTTCNGFHYIFYIQCMYKVFLLTR